MSSSSFTPTSDSKVLHRLTFLQLIRRFFRHFSYYHHPFDYSTTTTSAASYKPQSLFLDRLYWGYSRERPRHPARRNGLRLTGGAGSGGTVSDGDGAGMGAIFPLATAPAWSPSPLFGGPGIGAPAPSDLVFACRVLRVRVSWLLFFFLCDFYVFSFTLSNTLFFLFFL